jgi:hypothetical protein
MIQKFDSLTDMHIPKYLYLNSNFSALRMEMYTGQEPNA